jgi:hypothetical protein
MQMFALAALFLLIGGLIIAAAFALVVAVKLSLFVVVPVLVGTLWALLGWFQRRSPRG